MHRCICGLGVGLQHPDPRGGAACSYTNACLSPFASRQRNGFNRVAIPVNSDRVNLKPRTPHVRSVHSHALSCIPNNAQNEEVSSQWVGSSPTIYRSASRTRHRNALAQWTFYTMQWNQRSSDSVAEATKNVAFRQLIVMIKTFEEIKVAAMAAGSISAIH